MAQSGCKADAAPAQYLTLFDADVEVVLQTSASGHGSDINAGPISAHLEIRNVEPPEVASVTEPAVVNVEEPVSDRIERYRQRRTGQRWDHAGVSSRVLVDGLAEHSVTQVARGNIVFNALFSLPNTLALTSRTALK